MKRKACLSGVIKQSLKHSLPDMDKKSRDDIAYSIVDAMVVYYGAKFRRPRQKVRDYIRGIYGERI